MDEPCGWRNTLGELTLILATLGIVMGTMAGLLRGLDALPGYLGAEPSGVKRYRSVENLEQALGERLLLPAYFPDTLRWPPASARLSSIPPRVVALSVAGREGDEERLGIYQTVDAAGPIPPRLLHPGRVLYTTVVPLKGLEGTLTRIVAAHGEIWHDLAWRQEGRQVVLRFKGPVEELLKIARSMKRGGA